SDWPRKPSAARPRPGARPRGGAAVDVAHEAVAFRTSVRRWCWAALPNHLRTGGSMASAARARFRAHSFSGDLAVPEWLPQIVSAPRQVWPVARAVAFPT